MRINKTDIANELNIPYGPGMFELWHTNIYL